jgi:hypothetical protein
MYNSRADLFERGTESQSIDQVVELAEHRSNCGAKKRPASLRAAY